MRRLHSMRNTYRDHSESVMTNITNKFKQQFPALTANTPTEKLERLVDLMHEESYLKGETIIHQGLAQDSLFFVIDGILNVHIFEDGHQLDLGETLPGNIVGEISVFGHCDTTAMVVAKTDCKLLSLNKSDLAYLEESTPEILGQLLRVTAKTIANRIIMSDRLMYQRFCDENTGKENNLENILSWCAGLYQKIHGYERIER